MKINYRKIESTEAKTFRRIRLEALKKFPENFGTRYDDEIKKPRLHFEEIIERGDCSDVFFFGAFTDGGELIGIAGFVRETRAKTRHRGEIVSMYVEPDFHGQKIGENLLRALIETAFEVGGIEQIQLTVVAENRVAVRLYERIGFKTFGVQKEYFKAGEKYWDQRFMQLMKSDFRKIKDDFSKSEI